MAVQQGQAPMDGLAVLLQLLQGGSPVPPPNMSVQPASLQSQPGAPMSQPPMGMDASAAIPRLAQRGDLGQRSPDSRIASGFDAAAGADTRPRLQFERTQAAPNEGAPEPGAPLDLAAAAGGDGRPRLAGAMGGVRDFANDVFAGVGGDPNTQPLSAFAQGWSGAAQSQQAREDRKSAKELAAEDRQYKREDRAFDQGIRTRAETRAEGADKRASRKDEFGNLLTAARIEDIQKRAKTTGLTVANTLEIERLTNEYATKQLGMSEPLYGSKSAEDKKADLAKVDAFRQDLTNRAKASLPDAAGAEAPGSVPGATPGLDEGDTGGVPGADPATSAASDGMQGDGSQAAPFKGITDRKQFEALPSGAYILDESGKLLRKK